ncbi:hypothetical protein GQ600_4909 [Phytophthora cactorum]|nr:hypothetical protein GQ600_4909 [Phytophthora cactorum]
METEHGSLSVLEDEVTSARASTISSNSRASYLSSTTRFLEWMFTNKRSLIHDSFAKQLCLMQMGKQPEIRSRPHYPRHPPTPDSLDRITARAS